MKNFLIAGTLLALATVSLTSCYDRDRDPMPEYSSVGLVKATIDPATDTIPFLPARASVASNPASRPQVTITFDLYSQREAKIAKLFVYRTVRRGTVAGAYSYSPRLVLDTITTFPTTRTYDTQQLLTGMVRLGIDAVTNQVTVTPSIPVVATQNNRIFQTDSFLFTYEYELENGQRITLTPTSKTTVGSETYETVSGAQSNEPFALAVPVR